MAVFAHKIHLPLRKVHEIEKDNQARDWFWLSGYENDPLKKKPKKQSDKKDQQQTAQEME